MSTRAEREAGLLVSGEMNGRRLAEHLGVPHGTVKRWLHEGMPARRDPRTPGAWVCPEAAEAWIARRFNGRKTVAFDRAAYVYVAQREDGAVKIGWTSDVMRRVQELRKYVRGAVALVACRPGDKRDELALHRTFDAHRVDGEWFAAPLADVVAAMERGRAA